VRLPMLSISFFMWLQEAMWANETKSQYMQLQLAKKKKLAKRFKCPHGSRALLHRLLWRELLERSPLHDLAPRVNGVAEDGILRGKDKHMIQ
jgi:hypothetical protein